MNNRNLNRNMNNNSNNCYCNYDKTCSFIGHLVGIAVVVIIIVFTLKAIDNKCDYTVKLKSNTTSNCNLCDLNKCTCGNYTYSDATDATDATDTTVVNDECQQLFNYAKSETNKIHNNKIYFLIFYCIFGIIITIGIVKSVWNCCIASMFKHYFME